MANRFYLLSNDCDDFNNYDSNVNDYLHDDSVILCSDSDTLCTPSSIDLPQDPPISSKKCNNKCNTNNLNVKKLSSEKGMLIACLNVRGLLNKYDQTVKLINDNDLDVFGMCETFLDHNVEYNEFAFHGYNVVCKHRNRHGGGVLLYVKESLRFEVIEMNVCENVESVWINLKCNSESIAIGVIYRPPSANAAYYNSMLDQLDYVNAHYDKVIVMGDLNFNYKFDCELRSNPVFHIETMYNMKQLVTQPTRVTLSTSTLLDVILSNISECHTKTGVYETNISDHYMVYTVLNYEKTKSEYNVVRFRNYKSFNVSVFIDELKSCSAINDIGWSSNMLDSKWNEFKENFIAISNKHAPVVTRRLKRRNNPWVTSEIVKLMYERDYVKKLAVKNNDADLWNRFRQLRNTVTRLLKENKRKYASEKLNECSGNSSKMWKTLKNLTGKDLKKPTPSNLSAEQFIDFFSSIGETTVAGIQTNSPDDNLYWKCQKSIYNFELDKASNENVSKSLASIGNDSAMDVLEFDGKLLYLARDIICPIICKFIDASIASKYVLKDWKISRITPVYKGKGSMEDLGNYRPISVISHIGKVIEKEIQKQIMNHLDKYQLITPDQSAFLKKHNTQTSLHRVVDDLLWNTNDGLITGICSLDIKKCFDTINHKILLKKLTMYGFSEDVLAWFTSYLSSRGAKVYCRNEYSDIKTTNIGVPQGSVLGPTLFLLYVNDINNYLGNAVCNLYADDVLIYCSGENVSIVNDKLQNSLSLIKEWYDKNRLVVNASKSSTMMVTTRQREASLSDNMELFLGEDKLQDVECCDYLGLKIDKNLSWNKYVNSLCNQLCSKIWVLSRLRKFLPFNSLVQIYKSYIQPKIDYAITVWGYSNENNMDKIQRMQNRAVRAIYNNYDYVNVRGIELVSIMNVMNVRQRRDYFMSLLVFKCLHGLAPEYLCNEIIMAIEVAERIGRNVNENDLYVPNVNMNCTKNAFSYRGPVTWNNLENHMKECTNINDLKSKAKAYFVNC